MKGGLHINFSDVRDFYEVNAQRENWIQAHGWKYSAEVARNTISDIQEKLQLDPSHEVIEVGCGSGMVLNALLAPGQMGWGMERFESLVRNAKRFGVDMARIRFLLGEAAALPFADNSFERVLCYSVFMHFPTRSYAAAAVEELIRVSRPGGLILIGDVCGYLELVRATWEDHRFGAEMARAILTLPWMKPVRWLLWPVRKIIEVAQRISAGKDVNDLGSLTWRHYSHGFFKRISHRNDCRIEVLKQHIPGREKWSRMRFDVLIIKP